MYFSPKAPSTIYFVHFSRRLHEVRENKKKKKEKNNQIAQQQKILSRIKPTAIH